MAQSIFALVDIPKTWPTRLAALRLTARFAGTFVRNSPVAISDVVLNTFKYYLPCNSLRSSQHSDGSAPLTTNRDGELIRHDMTMYPLRETKQGSWDTPAYVQQRREQLEVR